MYVFVCPVCCNIYVPCVCTVEPLLWGHPFCIRKVAFQEGWPLVRDRNQFIYVYIYSVQWPLTRGWPPVRVASQKGFHCICSYLCVLWFGCLTSHRQWGHSETAPPFTVPCEEREAWFLHRSHRESNPGPSRCTPLCSMNLCVQCMCECYVYECVLCMNVCGRPVCIFLNVKHPL